MYVDGVAIGYTADFAYVLLDISSACALYG